VQYYRSTAGCRSSLAVNDEDGCTCQGHTKEPLLCSYRTPMILEDLSCYSSPLHPISRHCQQLWMDTDLTSSTAQDLTTAVEHSPSISRQAGCYADATGDVDSTRCAPVVTESRYCSSDCPGSPCAVCRLLGDDVAPSSEYVENTVRRQQQRCKLTRQGEPPSATPCGTPQRNPNIEGLTNVSAVDQA